MKLFGIDKNSGQVTPGSYGIPYNLKVLRAGLNMNQTEFAKELGISRQFYSHIETGKRKMSKNTQSLLNDKFDIDITKTPVFVSNTLQEAPPAKNTKVKKHSFESLDVFSMRDKKVIAKDFYVNKGYTAKFTAAIVIVTEKTMTDWVRKYNWKELKEAELKKILSPEVVTPNLKLEVLQGFKSHVKKSNKYLAKKLDQLIEEYLTTDNSNS